MSGEGWAIRIIFKLFWAIFYVLCKMRLIVPVIIYILLFTVLEDWYSAHELLGNIIFCASFVLSLLSWFIGPVKRIIAKKREKDYIRVTEENNQLMERLLLKEQLKKNQGLNNEQPNQSEHDEVETL